MTMMRFRSVAALAVLALGLVVGAFMLGAEATARQDAARNRPTFMLNLTSGQEDVHAAWMGLRLAQYALDENREVVIFLNVRGAEFARADLPDAIRFRDEKPMREILQNMMSRGAVIYACPHCMGVCGITEDNMLAGIETASPKMFEHMKADTVVFSY